MNPEQASPDWGALELLCADEHGATFSGEFLGAPATILRLNPAAAARTRRRMHTLRAAPELRSRRVLGADLEASPPWLALESWSGTLQSRPVECPMEALRLILDLTRVLAAAHRVGLVHGELHAGTVGFDLEERVVLCFLHTRSRLDADMIPRAPEFHARMPRPSVDVFGLGCVILTTLDTVDDAPYRDALSVWTDRLLANDPAARPTLGDFERALTASAQTSSRPNRIGRYLVRDVIHQEQTGVVQYAVDALNDERVVLTTCTSIDRTARMRFLDMAERLAVNSHPHLTPVIDVGEDGGALFFAARISGSELLTERLQVLFSVPERTAARWLAGIASALRVIHDLGWVHGHVDPDAIVFDGERAKLTGVGTCTVSSRDRDPRDDVRALGRLLASMIDPAEASSALRTLLEGCASENPPSAHQLASTLLDLGGTQRGDLEYHPAPPDDGNGCTSKMELRLNLRASPAALWPWISNTERINQAIGLNTVEESVVVGEDGQPSLFGRSSVGGMDLVWRERPHEWLAGKRMGVVREFERGPLLWLKSTVDLRHADGGGTELVHSMETRPRNLLGRATAFAAIDFRARRALERVYTRIDAFLTGEITGDASHFDAFGKVEPLPREAVDRLQAAERRLADGRLDPRALTALVDFIRFAPPMELARIQPIALAYRTGVDEESMLTACMAGAAEGLLIAGWDLLCPSCRAPSSFSETLAALTEHGHCKVCALDFALDLSEAVELVFRPDAGIRSADRNTYCLSSPAHAPHVVAQVTLVPDEHLVVSVALAEASWQLTRRAAPAIALETRSAPQLPCRAEIALGAPPEELLLRAGQLEIALHNDTAREVRVRLEPRSRRTNALTAACAVAHPLFASVFPASDLEHGVRLHASDMTLVLCSTSGDAPLLTALLDAARVAGGADGHGSDPTIVIFASPEQAFRWATSAVQAGARASLELGSVLFLTSAEKGFDPSGAALDCAAENFASARDRDLIVGPAFLSHPVAQQIAHDFQALEVLNLAGVAGPSGVRYRPSV